MAKIEDDYSLNDDGTITFAFDTVTRVLRRPSLKQYREAVEELARVRSGLFGGDLLNPKIAGVDEQLDKIIGWFDTVFVALAGEGLPRTPEGEIDDAVLPSWLLNGDIIQEMVSHWQTSPNRRGAQ